MVKDSDTNIEKIIKGCIEKDRKSQEELFKIFYGKALSSCMRYIRSKEQAEDVVQECFIKVFDKIHTYNPENSFDGWIRRVFINLSLDFIRKKKMVFVDELFDVKEEVKTEDVSDYSNIPMENIIKALDFLPDAQRTVFNMYVVEGYKHKEIAEILDITEGTSKSNYSRAKKTLVHRLSGFNKN